MMSSRGPGPAAPNRPTVLQRILSETREELEQRKRRVPLEALDAQVAASGARISQGREERFNDTQRAGSGERSLHSYPGRFHEALAQPGIGVIAEFKRRSPSAGSLSEGANLEAIVGAYERGGASALSVLTEGPNFEGSLADLRAARAVSGLPILRKDFIVDPYQLHEARAAGADAVLLIVAALDQEELASLYELARKLGLDVLVEVHDRQELTRAASVGARLIGVNNRDLRDFTVDVQRTSRLLGEMPECATVVSESGITAPGQLGELERQGVSAVLIGETLMRASDPQRALTALLAGSHAEASSWATGAGA